MAIFTFQNVILQHLPDNQGWQIIGVKKDKSKEQIALLAPSVDDWLAQLLADTVAQNMTGIMSAQIE